MNNQISQKDLKAMRFGVHPIGNHVSVKLRYKIDILETMIKDDLVRPYLPELTIVRNCKGTHGVIACVLPQKTDIGYRLFTAYRKALCPSVPISFDSTDTTLFS